MITQIFASVFAVQQQSNESSLLEPSAASITYVSGVRISQVNFHIIKIIEADHLTCLESGSPVFGTSRS